MSPERKHTFPRTPLTHQGRFRMIEDWGTEQMGTPARLLGPAETRARLPKLMGLRYNAKATHSPAGGRFDFHLRHIPDVEILERLARADRFVEDTKASRDTKDVSGPQPPAAHG